MPNQPFLHAAQLTLGDSGPVFGLIGALYHYGRTTSSGVKQSDSGKIPPRESVKPSGKVAS